MGVSQIFVVDNVVSGNVIALGLLVQQPSWAFHAVGGSAVGALTGLMMGAPLDEILHGLWGFNSALTALSVAVFYEPSRQTYVLAGAGAAATAVVFGGLKTALGACAVPALTLPFCAVATGCSSSRTGVWAQAPLTGRLSPSPTLLLAAVAQRVGEERASGPGAAGHVRAADAVVAAGSTAAGVVGAVVV